MTGLQWFVVIAIGGYFVFFSLFRAQCSARHPIHGRCALRPSHFPEMHTNIKGKKWR
jgi:hypothetical protein